MYSRVLIKQAELSDMIKTINNKELSNNLQLERSPACIRGKDCVNRSEMSLHNRKYDQEFECLLLSLMIIKNSTHRLILKMGKGFLYEYRNIYLADDGIVITDKEADSDYVRFTLAPYITFAIGAIACIGEPGTGGADRFSGDDSAESRDAVPKIFVEEISPEGEAAYESRCNPGTEPEEIDRMVKFIVFSHRACLKEMAENG